MRCIDAADLSRQRCGQNDRGEQRQNFGGTALGQRHVQETKQQHDPHRRQLYAAEQRQPNAEQQADFERT